MEELTTTRMIYDYSEILKLYGITYSPVDYYWQVGETKQTQGWVLHLSVILVQLEKLLRDIIPDLLAQGLPFRIVRDANLAFYSLEGGLGYPSLGKMVSIYPRNEQEAAEVAKWLIERTSSFRGPHIPTDRHLGGIVYTRYGSITPVLIKNATGEWVKHVYDVHGQLVRDPYNIPFILPDGIAWPFRDITMPEKVKVRKLLNYRYYPLFILKPDAKGDVIRALYFKRPWQIKSCLIKQGRPNMFADEHGRDIRDRLRWQHELYQALHEDIPMPQVFDYFEDDGATYLAMEFIKGKTLTSWVNEIYKDRSWLHLSPYERVQLLDQLLKLLTIINCLHKKGYVHRDITPENFLVDKKGRIFLIDMELTWSAVTSPPQPPFQLGTPGHMSPEQIAAQKPTVKEDIFGVGSLVFVFLTNLYALKFIGQDPLQMQQSLEFLTGDTMIANCITSCWSATAAERPSLSDIADKLTTCRKKWTKEKTIETNNSKPAFIIPTHSEIRRIVQGGINNLGSPALLSPKNRWISQSLQKETHIGNRQIGMELYEGWHTGMAGPLWLVALAKKIGFSVEYCQTPYVQSWDYIKKNYFAQQERASPGLHAGNSGIALALVEGLNNGLLVPEPDILVRLQQCFSITADQPHLAEGLTGQGLALLRCSAWLDDTFTKTTLPSYINMLIKQQHKDGSWNIYTGVDRGAAGIVLFLLSYLETASNDNINSSVIKAMEWLERIGKRSSSKYSWPVRINSKLVDKWSTGFGLPGIVLAFIKAYEVLKDSSYQQIAEQCLLDITEYPMNLDLTLGSGLAGLGETYLEAFRVFKDPIWLDRANWIAAVLFHCFRPAKNDTGYWLTWITDVTTADLFSGNGGIIHFMMRFLYPEVLRHPLL